jgi:hypothetical protein
MAAGVTFLFGAAAALAMCCCVAAQTDQQRTAATSDLARQNMKLVAASAAQIKAILVQDPGMMVQLKQWVAKDATDHGQIVSEEDLSDQTILDRIENDLSFRSVATRLVQQFGFLVPQVNPASEMGKQQELLMQERVKLIAQQEQQEAAQDRSMQLAATQGTPECPQGIAACANAQGQSPAAARSTLQPANRPVAAPSAPVVMPPAQPARGGSGPGVQQATYAQPGGQQGNDMAMLGLSAAPTQFSGLDRGAGTNNPFAQDLPGAMPGMGITSAGVDPMANRPPDLSSGGAQIPSAGRGAEPSAIPPEVYGRGLQESELAQPTLVRAASPRRNSRFSVDSNGFARRAGLRGRPG